MRRQARLRVQCAFAFLAAIMGGAGSATYGQDAFRTAIASRLERLQNFTIRYEMLTEVDFDTSANLRQAEKGTTLIPAKVLPELRAIELRHFHQRLKIESRLAQEKSGGLEPPYELIAISDGRVESLIQRSATRPMMGMIDSKQERPLFWIVDFAMPIQLWGPPGWLTPEQLIGARALDPADGPGVIFDGPNGVVHQLHFNRDAGYALDSYKRIHRAPGEFEEIVCSDFREAKGIFVPYKISAKSFYRDRTGQERRAWTWTVTVKDFVPDDPNNTEASMAITWPGKIEVFDNRNNFLIPPTNEPRVLSDADIAREMARQGREYEDLQHRAQERLDRVNAPAAPAPAGK